MRLGTLADAAARQPLRRRACHQAPDALRPERSRFPRRMQEELRIFAARLRSEEFAAAAQAFFGKSAARSGGGT